MKLATTAGTTLTLALTLFAPHGSAQDTEVPSQPENRFFDTTSILAAARDEGRTFGAFRAGSLDFAHGAATWQQPFGPSLTLASRNASAIFATIDLGNTRPEPRWKAKDALTTGFPPTERGKNHLSETIARGMLGFVIGRAVAELAGEAQARKSYVKVRSAADPHGKGVGLGLSASW